MPKTPSPKKPELLAPAGSFEAALAALEAGADAVYLGLTEGSARGRAKNFELADLRRLVPFAHARRRRVYVAMNTLVTEAELPALVPVLWELAALPVDGLILQDLGLWHLCRQAFPELALHASTQLSIHNAAGVRQLERMGFARAVLARECTIPELAEIRRRSSLKLEAFVHGALCYSVSGMCLASSALEGRSANRGWCAQPCRWGFRSTDEGPEAFPFSCSDLSLVGRVWELAEAGVDSLKIEGRLKGADYVHAVVRAYRKVLDAPESDRPGAAGAAREILRSVAGRPETEGFAFHPRPREVLHAGGRPAWGTPIGKVVRLAGGRVTIACGERLRRGDRLRVVAGSGGEGHATVLRDLERGKKSNQVSFPWPWPATAGDSVYRVKGSWGEELEQRLAKEARGLDAGRRPVKLRVSVSEAEVSFAAACGPARAEGSVAVDTYPAEEHPLTWSVLEKHLGRLGSTPYELAEFRVEGTLPQVVVPPSAFKEVRRAVTDALDRAWEAELGRRLAAVRELRAAPEARPKDQRRLWLKVEGARGLREALAQPAARMVLAMDRECLKARTRLLEDPRVRERVVWELPPWLAEGDAPALRRELEGLEREGYREVLATNLSHFDLLSGLGFRVHAGRELHVLNGWAAGALKSIGAATVTPSPESDGANLAAIARAGWPARPVVLAYGNLPWFTTRLALPGPDGGELSAGNGRGVWWAEVPKPLGQSWGRVYGPEPLCWFGRLSELAALGVSDFLVALEGRRYSEGELRGLLGHWKAGQNVAPSTELNYERGLR